ncbi:MAG: glycoside hydrolase family 32 protein, partial [Lachnospiraceae bacterium]
MLTETLERARRFEANEGRKICSKERPAFHVSPRVGWMNDPNGFSFYKGLYHIFYQYHPYSSHWGPMHWGHAVSSDLLRWTAMPCAMAPDTPYDQNGCFSGSAISLSDGRQLLMYTGVAEGGAQTQCLAVGDGTEYEKCPGNPVVDASMLPEDASRIDFRDPHIWQEPDGSFRAVAGNLTGSGETERAKFFLFTSPDGFCWTYAGVFAENTFGFGRMWECPDVFALDGKIVVLASVVEMDQKAIAALKRGVLCQFEQGKTSENRSSEADETVQMGGKENGNFCLLGTIHPKTGEFLAEAAQTMEDSFDFYAAQTLLSPDGRRILIAWMQGWESIDPKSRERAWFGQMTLPRELFIRDGRLCQMPVRELLACRRDEIIRENIILEDGELELRGIRGRILDLEIILDVGENSKTSVCADKNAQKTTGGAGVQGLKHFALTFAKNDAYRTVLSYDAAESIL